MMHVHGHCGDAAAGAGGSRYGNTRDALLLRGGSIAGAGTTTCGSCALLLFCKVSGSVCHAGL